MLGAGIRRSRSFAVLRVSILPATASLPFVKFQPPKPGAVFGCASAGKDYATYAASFKITL